MRFSIKQMLIFTAWFAVAVVLCKLASDRYCSHPDWKEAVFDGWWIFYLHAAAQWIGTVGGCTLFIRWLYRDA